MAEGQLQIDVLVAALDARRREKNLSWRDLAKEAGVSPSTLTRMQQGKRPDVDTFGALVAWLKMPAEHFLGLSKPRAQASGVVQVSTLLKGKKELSTEAAAALDEILHAAFKLFKDSK
jgi:transcriptional regulator with XRE-family HTH domain